MVRDGKRSGVGTPINSNRELTLGAQKQYSTVLDSAFARRFSMKFQNPDQGARWRPGAHNACIRYYGRLILMNVHGNFVTREESSRGRSALCPYLRLEAPACSVIPEHCQFAGVEPVPTLQDFHGQSSEIHLRRGPHRGRSGRLSTRRKTPTVGRSGRFPFTGKYCSSICAMRSRATTAVRRAGVQ